MCVCVETLIKAFSISATSLAVVTTRAELAEITALRESAETQPGRDRAVLTEQASVTRRVWLQQTCGGSR